MTESGDGSAIGSAVPITVPSLPRPPASTELPPLETDRRQARVRTGARVVSLALAGVLGVALGVLLGAALVSGVPPAASSDRDAAAVHPTVGAPPVPGLTGAQRAERVIAVVLAAAPTCTPEIRMAGAPASERSEFMEEAERLATEASDEQGLRSVHWKVIERDGRLFGVLYGERCA